MITYTQMHAIVIRLGYWRAEAERGTESWHIRDAAIRQAMGAAQLNAIPGDQYAVAFGRLTRLANEVLK